MIFVKVIKEVRTVGKKKSAGFKGKKRQLASTPVNICVF